MRRSAFAPLVALLCAMTLPAPAVADPVIDERFDGGALPAGWAPREGAWTVEGGRLVGRSTSSAQLSRLTFGPRLENYRFEATLRFESLVNNDGSRWTALGLDMPPGGDPPWWQAALRSNSVASNGTEFAQRTAANTWNVPATAPAPSAAGVGRDVRVKIEVYGTKARWFFDGTLTMERKVLQRSATGGLGFLVNGATVSFDDVLVSELPPEPLVRPDDRVSVPAVIAHRGYSSITPENTLAAMAAGARAGSDWVEIDVATSADGVPYVLHDNTVDRTTAGTGALNTLQSSLLDTLEAGSWFSPAFAGQPLPRFSAALDELVRGSSDLLLEIKGPETRAELERIIGMVRDRGLIGRVLLQSFDEQVLRDAYAIEPSLRLGLLRGALDADPVAVSRALHVITYNPSWDALAARRDVVRALNDAGIAVMPYTVDDPGLWLQMRDAGVDGIITNKPGMLDGWNARYKQGVPPAVIKAPVDRAKLTRGDVVTLAFEGSGAATLDGRPIAEGDSIRADDLALGRHEIDLAGTRTTFTVLPTARGIAHLVAVRPGVPDVLRVRWLKLALDRSWDRLLREVGEHEQRLDPEAAKRLLEDIAALRAAG